MIGTVLAALGWSLLLQSSHDRGVAAQTAAPEGRVEPHLAEGPLATPDDELNAAFTPDGRTLYFTRKLGGRFGVIMFTHRRGDRWSEPVVAPFSGQYADFDPFVAPDGNRIFWMSNRPVAGVPKSDYDLWMAERKGDGWGPATRLEAPVNSDADEYYPTVAANGTLYFTSSRPGGKGRGDLYRSRLEGGRYLAPENLGDSVNSAAFDGDGFIAPDESYLIFTSYGRAGGDPDGDLYLSTRNGEGWSAARRLDRGINSEAQEYTPTVSPDGRWFYFTSLRAPIDAPLTHPMDATAVRRVAYSVLNGRGNLYRVPLSAILPQN